MKAVAKHEDHGHVRVILQREGRDYSIEEIVSWLRRLEQRLAVLEGKQAGGGGRG